MKVSMPTGNRHGWGIAGHYLAQEIARLPKLDGVTLHCISGHDFEPHSRDDWGRINIGYCFFEHDILADHALGRQDTNWDFIVAGSRWCEYHLRLAGIRNTTTILQGVDPALFSPSAPREPDGRFIVFSGGKFEYRKGQDIVIAAMRTFMERHPDAWLACIWENQWPLTMKTMEQSGIITYSHRDESCDVLLPRVLEENGIDLRRVLLHPPADNSDMAARYRASDIGLFPNRCEGGNNMVMCEYMACGRPVIASGWSGHADVLTPDNSFILRRFRPEVISTDRIQTAVWFEADVQEVLEALEAAYQSRELRESKGRVASSSMAHLSWREAARRFHAIGAHLLRVRTAHVILSDAGLRAVAESLFTQGRFAEAEAVFRQCIAAAPLDPELYNSLGTALDRQERYREAELAYLKALALRPGFAVARFNCANTLKRLGRLRECEQELARLTTEFPEFIDAWHNLAVCHAEAERTDDAIRCLEHIVSRSPGHAAAWVELAELYRRDPEKLPESLHCFEAALQAAPGSVRVLNGCGLVLHELERYGDAEGCFRAALEAGGDDAEIISNLGVTLLARGDFTAARGCFEHSLSIWPDEPSTLFNHAMTCLIDGDWERGWEEYEARFTKQDPACMPATELPLWCGEPLAGRVLLVRMEQGYGDAIMFSRYLPLLAGQGAAVTLECLDSVIAPLFADTAALTGVITRGEEPPPCDFQVPIGSLPRLFATHLGTIPPPEGVVAVTPDGLRRWNGIIDEHWDRVSLKVGLVWSGRKPRLNADRSIDAALLSTLAGVTRVTFYSLQTGPGAVDLERTGLQLVDLGSLLHDFSDTAAAIACLDLVITIDTAAAHLAGSLGVPVWVLLKRGADWRWLRERPDSPWYASARLFRQAEAGVWDHVLRHAAAALSGEGEELLRAARCQHAASRPEPALRLFRRLLESRPAWMPARLGAGFALLESGRPDEAEALFRELTETDSEHPDPWYGLGMAAGMSGDRERSEALLRESLARDPSYHQAHNALGLLLMRAGRLEEAYRHFREAVALKPEYDPALLNLGVVCRACGRYDDSLAWYDRLLAFSPADADARFNRALTLLAQGEYREGWREYEWRFRKSDPVASLHAGLPRWQGEPLCGRTLLIHCEQGYGDTIQFSRYALKLAGQGERVVFECQDSNIASLFTGRGEFAAVTVRGEAPPAVDVQIPLMSLPAMFCGENGMEFGAAPYLAPREAKRERWRSLLGSGSGALRCGIAWAGRPEYDNDHLRSLDAQLLAPFFSLPCVEWHSLQLGSPIPPAVRDHSALLTDFSETAALMSCLDLIVTVDTAVAHLAGALGMQVWLMLPFAGDWRWSSGRPDSPWYPAMTLFRQTAPGDWLQITENLAEKIKLFPATNKCLSGT